MKKLFCVFSVWILVFLSACSVQEKMNSRIFIQRFKDNNENITILNDEVFSEQDRYFCFLKDDKNNNYVLQFATDSDSSIKKICLVCNNASKTDTFKVISETVIKTYAPNEDSQSIVESLFKDGLNYYDTQWYRYSSSIADGTAFFSVENMKISTESDAELTLRTNDITYP